MEAFKLTIMKKALIIAMTLLMTVPSFAQNKKKESKKNDKMEKTEQFTFQLSDPVTREKVTFKNRYGITISGHLYRPKNSDTSKKYAAL
ncbi:MAG: uncharacterized protein QG594_155, partial [Bacteroidota bacterium]|nr:uncharacterized protein [Bacteroidota bacterium]